MTIRLNKLLLKSVLTHSTAKQFNKSMNQIRKKSLVDGK